MMALTDKPWLPAAALVAVSSAVVLTAFLFEHIGGLAPCELCWYQRYAHMAGLAGALSALYFNRYASVDQACRCPVNMSPLSVQWICPGG